MPKVSVILTSYNHDKYLREAIESVLNQTFQDFELIIWDDDSVDDSWNIIQSYSDSRIQAVTNPQNKGPVFGINKAIFDIASGEYIAIHHSDDVWELDKLEKQVDYLDANQDVGAVFTWGQIIDEHSVESTADCFYQENKTRWQWLNQLFLERNHLCHPSVLIRKLCYQDVGVYHLSLFQTPDAEMWSRVLIKFPIHVIQEKLTKHRKFSDKSNVSGEIIESVIRANNEWNVLRKNYLTITNFEELVATFPSLERYRNSAGFDNKFLLAMACLYECKQKNAWQLGLTWLFELLNDPVLYQKIIKLYAFSYTDLIKLTAEFDVYFSEWEQHEKEVIRKCALEEQGLNEVIVVKDEIINNQAQEIRRLNEVVVAKDAAVTLQAQEIGRLNEVIEAKDTAVTLQDQEIRRLNEVVVTKDVVITHLEEDILRIHQSKWHRLGKSLKIEGK